MNKYLILTKKALSLTCISDAGSKHLLRGLVRFPSRGVSASTSLEEPRSVARSAYTNDRLPVRCRMRASVRLSWTETFSVGYSSSLINSFLLRSSLLKSVSWRSMCGGNSRIAFAARLRSRKPADQRLLV